MQHSHVERVAQGSGARTDTVSGTPAPFPLRSVSLAVMLLCLGMVEPVSAADNVTIVNRGADGRDGETAFFWTSAGKGDDAPGSSLTQRAPIAITDVTVSAIEVGSVGGAGGSVYSKGVFHNVPGKPGGSGGPVSLTVESAATISGTIGSSASAKPLIQAYSRGGTGGLGYTSWTESEAGIARGGDGGTVNVNLASSVTANTESTPRNRAVAAIAVSSQGGAAGVSKVDGRPSADGTYASRVDTDRGGSGGDVSVTMAQSANVTVRGALTPALSVSSQGGNGGQASNSGGYPSNGGHGGRVELKQAGTITTDGNNATAVILQSAGGAGGSGANGAFGAGTPGGKGGTGGTVQGENSGTITTQGNYSFGIMAQSVGGVGGSGGGAAFVSGGDGGGAGLGGATTVTNTGTIRTTGTGSAGILAQSIGGGSALDAFHATQPAASKGGGSGGSSGILPFASGGTGGLGGVGGDVTVNHRGVTSTTGDAAQGVLLQSVGGGGGTGGKASSLAAGLAVALGGTGGGGGNGGSVVFTSNLGSIETQGKRATAVLAQSVGGGGGTGGFATAGSVAPGLSAASATGGSGGKGGQGGKVLIDNNAAVRTAGEAALGLQASSIGGGGGTGGGASAFAVALPVVTPSGQPLPSITLTNAIGGSGGDGGNGKDAQVYNKNAGVETLGVGATGILAQSIGGGGGNAGNAVAYGLAIAAPGATAFNVSNAIGGSGGGGGAGDLAKVYNDGSVLTHGNGALGIHVQSIGGGGGNGGSASASADALSLYRTVAFGQTIGGTNSKGGGKGGSVEVDNHGLIDTRGTGATGILLQSIGGGGGYGGAVNASATSGLSFDKTLNKLVHKLPLADAVTLVDAIGGNGGNGGDGGAVNAKLAERSVIRTHGAQADGLLAQSVGGGGGAGGGGSAAASGTLSVNLSMGGRGGAGGAGGNIDVFNAGTVHTQGNASHGLFAQSIGGGGGNGGNLAAPADTPDTVGELLGTLERAVGVEAYQKWAADKKNASDKEALDALIKDVQNSDTYKSLADAFKKSDFYKEMQTAGKQVSTYLDQQSKNAVKRPDVSLTLAMGGDGGTGNRGGVVKLEHEGFIQTDGHVSHGMLAQSVGGGGGQGGVSYSSGTNKTNLSASLGGRGGSGNVGGTVTVTQRGTVQTYGQAAYGVYAQSVGGGGGQGVGALSSDNENLVLNLTAGGAGGTGGHGGNVTVNSYGTTQTRGEEAHAIVAQSIGGGGGAFLMAPAQANASAPATTDDKAASDDAIRGLLKAVGLEPVPAAAVPADDKKISPKSGSFTLGGSGGASGVGGDVSVVHGGTITTAGMGSFGILAQSVGGGGGLANAAGSPGGVMYSASYGGKGGAAGQGGGIKVHFQNNAAIRTTGDHATAVFAQSIGGGGGYGGASVLQGYALPVFAGDGGVSSNGGTIDIRTLTGTTTIETTGAKAHGIFAQSLGGGGGTVSDPLKASTTTSAATNARAGARGTGGVVGVQANGNIQTRGAGAYGIFAQSGFQQSNGTLDPTRVGGKITVDYTGTLLGGSGEGAAIVVDGGDQNSIIIRAGSHVSALSGRSVVSTFGQETLQNYGTLVGDIDLAHGKTTERNTFRNEVGGTYVSGAKGVLNISNGAGWFHNAGTFDVGGVGTIGTANIKHVDTQLGGVLRVDVTSVAAAGAPTSDVLQGAKITIDGVQIRPNAVDGLLPGTFSVVSADALSTTRPATAGVSAASPIYWSTAQDNQSLSITPSADFVGRAPTTLTDTKRSLLASLQTAWDNKQPGMAGVFADMANIDSAQRYDTTLNSLTVTEDLGQPATSQTLVGRKSLNAALSCPMFEGSGVTLRETECAWGHVIGSRTTHDSGEASDAYRQNGLSYRVGGQWQIRPDWFLGATAAYNSTSMHTGDGHTSIRGKAGDVSVSLKHQTGPWLLAGALHAGYGRYDSQSLFMIGDDLWSAAHTNEVWSTGLRMRAAYQLGSDAWYVRPYADLDLLHSYMPGYTLSGDDAVFKAGAIREWSVAVSPTIEAGTRIDLKNGGWARPFVSVGATFINNKGFDSEVTFSEGGGQGITFTSTTALPRRLFNLGAGVQLVAKDGYELRAEYKAQMARDYRNQEVSLRLAMPF